MNRSAHNPRAHLLRSAIISAPIVVALAGALAYLRAEWNPSNGVFLLLVCIAALAVGGATVRIWMSEVAARTLRGAFDAADAFDMTTKRGQRNVARVDMLMRQLSSQAEAEGLDDPESDLYRAWRSVVEGHWVILIVPDGRDQFSLVLSDRNDETQTLPFHIADTSAFLAIHGFRRTVHRFTAGSVGFTSMAFTQSALSVDQRALLERLASELASRAVLEQGGN